MKAEILLVFLRDTSASMSSNAKSYESSMQEYFINLSHDDNANYRVLLVDFDTNSKVVATGVPLNDFELGAYNPHGGSTNLYDAVFTSTDAADAWLKQEAEAGRTYNVLFVMITDGEHNHTPEQNIIESGGNPKTSLSTCKHTMADVKAKLSEKENTGFWTMAYLGANQDAWAVASSIGLAAAANYAANAAGINSAMQSLSSSTREYSKGVTMGVMPSTKNFWQDDDDDKKNKK